MPETNRLNPEAESARRTRRSFLTMGATGLTALGAWSWLRTRPASDSLPGPFRNVLTFNERAGTGIYAESHLAPVFNASQVQPLRANGDLGLDDDFDPATWNLAIEHLDGRPDTRRLRMADIRGLPRVEHTTQLKCIEGWSAVNQWAGARFSDFTAAFAPESATAKYVSLRTEDGEYFVGIDMASAMHPQTLLCYEMNGAPLTGEHGAPLRLAIPVKYGIKNIKRPAVIAYTNQRPADYWAKEGYDWYAGL